MYVYPSVCDIESVPIPSIFKITYFKVSVKLVNQFYYPTVPKPTLRSATNALC